MLCCLHAKLGTLPLGSLVSRWKPKYLNTGRGLWTDEAGKATRGGPMSPAPGTLLWEP